MRRVGCWAAAILFVAAAAWGQDETKPEDLKKQLADTVAQLKDAQDRKAALATENAKLAAQLSEFQKQHQADTSQINDLKLQLAGDAERSFFLRMHYNAWTQFVAANPLVQMQWNLFLTRLSPVPPSIELPLMDPDWPLVVK